MLILHRIIMSEAKTYHYNRAFALENGQVLPELTIAYHTYGTMNAAKNNVVWVCHALTANSDAEDWWPGVVGEGQAINSSTHFIVCANIIGSCYGSSGPLSIDPATGAPYYSSFPTITIRDMVKAHILLREHLGIGDIHLLVGGSMGGYQALEWCVLEPEKIRNLVLLATSPAESAWGIAIHTTQRLAIEADSTWKDASPQAGQNGLKAARGMGLISYRNYALLVEKQSDPDTEKTDDYKASSYIHYQGEKLVKRFNAYSYWLLTKAMDSHHLARGRQKGIAALLRGFTQRTLIIGISSDILCPIQEQQFLAAHIPDSVFIEIDSAYGHDGFIVEAEKISKHVKELGFV
ncbi:MAG TPA: homoserine O-acetyltransferase [Chitinophagaceae bacterium]|nr:homoserine O-acetyltransferase [Chitinophagaceae bacterium]